MTPTNDFNAAPFTQPEDLKRLLATLPEPVLLAMIECKASELDLDWLALLVNSRAFELVMPDDGNYLHAYNAENQWALRCRAILTVMDKAHLMPVSNDAQEASNGDDPVLKRARACFDLGPTGNALLSQFCETVAKQLFGFISTTATDSIDQVAAQTIALAAMMNDTDLAQRLIEAHPAGLNVLFPSDAVGQGMLSHLRVNKFEQMHLSPYFCAVQFASIDCVRMMTEHIAIHTPFYSAKSEDRKRPTEFTFLESFADFRYPCDPDVLVPVLQKAVAQNDVNLRQDLKNAMTQVMRRKDGITTQMNNHLVDAFVQADVHKVDPKTLLFLAVANGWPQVVNGLQDRIDWNHFIQASSNRQSATANAIDQQNTSGLHALIDLALAQGQEKNMLDGFVLNEGVLTEDTALSLIACEKGVAVMARLIDLGLDPDMQTDHVTLRQLSEQSEHGAYAVIHSVLARKQARALVLDFESNVTQAAKAPCP